MKVRRARKSSLAAEAKTSDAPDATHANEAQGLFSARPDRRPDRVRERGGVLVIRDSLAKVRHEQETAFRWRSTEVTAP